MSNMVVRTNVFALNSHRNLTNVGHMQRQSAQRLSSGFRVNSAADDAAGLAISESMRAQIRGLDQASINAQDGVGLIQTAEGAMSTISDMVIRVRELMVQAANDTNTYGNREMIQLEIDQIMTEINDVTFRTQFNTRTLLAGGLGGEGGGPSSPVSLQWMVFDQARVIGLPQPGGIVTRVLPPNSRNEVAGRLPNVHWNENNRSETGMRSEMIGLQNELNALARRVAERKVADPSLDFDADDLSEMFEEMRDLDFSALDMIPAERTELQMIANRIESYMRNSLRAAEEMFQITQDQMNALGGQGAINFDGSSVFNGPAIGEWTDAVEGARTVLEKIREQFRLIVGEPGAPGTLPLAMDAGAGGALAAMHDVLDSLVGQMGQAQPTIPNPAWDVAVGSGSFTIPGTGTSTPITDPAHPNYGVSQTIPNAAWSDPPGSADYDPGTGYVDINDPAHPNYGIDEEIPNPAWDDVAGAGPVYVGGDTVPITDPAHPNYGLTATLPDPDSTGAAEPPTNRFLDALERLLDMSTDVLGNVNLESNAMWFQIGPNSMQGMILQLQGIHTGILGGGRGDLAMLIDVRERSGIPISEQLEFIDIAEGIVNGQRARLGAVQNRLEFTRQSLDISSENLSAAESRIRDTDMAREMMRFTQAQVLQQAGISMLAQANQLPASILQLLQ